MTSAFPLQEAEIEEIYWAWMETREEETLQNNCIKCNQLYFIEVPPASPLHGQENKEVLLSIVNSCYFQEITGNRGQEWKLCKLLASFCWKWWNIPHLIKQNVIRVGDQGSRKIQTEQPGGLCWGRWRDKLILHARGGGKEEMTPQNQGAKLTLFAVSLARGCQNTTSAE